MGYTFFSDGDTEVILKAYHAWGGTLRPAISTACSPSPSCTGTAEVCFLQATGSASSPCTTHARKTISSVSHRHCRRFWYTTTSIRTMDPVALHHYMTFHAVVPAPLTIIKGVRKLEPAAPLTGQTRWNDGPKTALLENCRASPPRSTNTSYSLDDWKELLRAVSSAQRSSGGSRRTFPSAFCCQRRAGFEPGGRSALRTGTSPTSTPFPSASSQRGRPGGRQ
jgi:asparagine synthase (glutamine-hydrolysing)